MMMRDMWNCRSWSPSNASEALHNSSSGWFAIGHTYTARAPVSIIIPL